MMLVLKASPKKKRRKTNPRRLVASVVLEALEQRLKRRLRLKLLMTVYSFA